MFRDHYQIDQVIAQRQAAIRDGVQQRGQPSVARVRAGLLLIRLGEWLRGYAQTPAMPPARPVRSVRPSRNALQ